MTDTPPTAEARDYRDTVFLPKTDFPMKAGLPQKEPAILAKWQSDDLYRQLRSARAGREKFILHDGPPYANGDMHIGHALNHILKDMVCRTQSLLGKDAPYVPGWDCHGLPIEWKVEEQYRKKKLNKDEVPVEEFRAECRAYAQNWVNVQREQLKRLGINGDWDNPYLTMDFAAEATIVEELLKFAESGQLYRGAKPVMWSPVEKTALAEAEVEYEDITSTQIDVAFEIVDSPIKELRGAHAVIWTTTPWTIPVNQAIAYGPDVEYSICKVTLAGSGVGEVDQDMTQWMRENFASHPMRDVNKILVASALVESLQERSMKGDHNVYLDVEAVFRGSDLAGTIARHPMAKLFAPLPMGEGLGEGAPPQSDSAGHPHRTLPLEGEGHPAQINPHSPLAEFFLRPRPFLPGDFVTTDSGTGLVHMAPDHGEDDFDLCKAHGIEPVFAVEGDGKYRADWAWLGGQGSVINPKFNAPDGPICTDLREAGALLAASADYKHSYPHSWRSKAKVIYRCTPQWFVPMDRGGEGDTLRARAMAEIERVRWVPEKGQNRIRSMVEGRPDWVLSRQRAWGVPITLFVDRRTGQYLNDAGVNARIVAAVREQGVDAWSDARAQDYLGADYNAADYERVTDILDVWFDSGCTHAFVLRSGRWPDLVKADESLRPADLYLEGSDQHRGWFQSSLLQSCGTRGRAPYDAVLTHGFTMASDGRKMSKSLGNTVDPVKLMETYGADILRLWALSVDFTEDHRIGDEILKGTADQYRKLRNTFRYMLGALEGFSKEERVAVDEMPELERYMLQELFHLDCNLRDAITAYDFNGYVRYLTDFCNQDLSRYFFDIRKDSLYCDVNPATGYQDDKRRAYRTVLDTLFHALVRYAAPVLVFTAEEVWHSRFPDRDSIHLQELPLEPYGVQDGMISSRFQIYNVAREDILEAIEPLRQQKIVRSSLEVIASYPWESRAQEMQHVEPFDANMLAELAMVERVDTNSNAVAIGSVEVTPTTHHKCGRCWRHLPGVVADGDLCGRCTTVLEHV